MKKTAEQMQNTTYFLLHNDIFMEINNQLTNKQNKTKQKQQNENKWNQT